LAVIATDRRINRQKAAFEVSALTDYRSIGT
jgi:hypothetical protein